MHSIRMPRWQPAAVRLTEAMQSAKGVAERTDEACGAAGALKASQCARACTTVPGVHGAVQFRGCSRRDDRF